MRRGGLERVSWGFAACQAARKYLGSPDSVCQTRGAGLRAASPGPPAFVCNVGVQHYLLIYVIFRATLHECLSVSLRFWRSQAEGFLSYFF
jgi:hypothetical protein